MLTPKVKVSFYMSGDDVDLDILTEQIGIKPTKIESVLSVLGAKRAIEMESDT